MRTVVAAFAFLLVLAAPAAAAEPFGRLPLAFEAHGDTFLARGAGYGIALGARESVLALDWAQVRMRLVGARAVAGRGERRRPGVIRRYTGRHSTVASPYGRVRYSGVWPGIDVVYHGRQRRLEYDFVVAPGVDPGAIRLRFSHRVTIERGALVVHTPAGRIVQPRPTLYQGRDRVRG